VGPNLTDKFWLHGGDIKSIFKTLTHGVPEKGMIAWNKTLNPLQIQKVASFILTLQGTNPAGAKEPQGTEVNKPLN
jgi:cytochrome c oxidase cbb3-type subunit 3